MRRVVLELGLLLSASFARNGLAQAAPDSAAAPSNTAGAPALSQPPEETSTTAKPDPTIPATVAGPGAGVGSPGNASDTVPTATVPAVTQDTAAQLLAETGTDTSAESGGSGVATGNEQRRLEIYGFADFTYQRLLVSKSNLWAHAIYPSTSSFAIGNFNVYLSSNLAENWNALAEVRFMFLPNGATNVDPTTGNVVRTDTTVLDYAGFDEPIRWGSIHIERIYLEHKFVGLAKLQIGQFLTPYGIWNVDHGSPTIVGIKKPIGVADQFFPESQTGIQLYGSAFINPVEIGYHLTLSNGRGPIEYQDFSDDKAIGGRVYIRLDAHGPLTIGSSFYRGGYYDRSQRVVTYPGPAGATYIDQQFTPISRYQEFSAAADVKWEPGEFLVQAEAMMNEAHFSTRPRLAVVTPPNGFQPDYLRWSAYGLIGYRLPWLPLMPYGLLQHFDSPNNPQRPAANGFQIGLNYRPIPTVALKLEYTDWIFTSVGSIGLGAFPLRLLAAQAAWAF